MMLAVPSGLIREKVDVLAHSTNEDLIEIDSVCLLCGRAIAKLDVVTLGGLSSTESISIG